MRCVWSFGPWHIGTWNQKLENCLEVLAMGKFGSESLDVLWTLLFYHHILLKCSHNVTCFSWLRPLWDTQKPSEATITPGKISNKGVNLCSIFSAIIDFALMQ